MKFLIVDDSRAVQAIIRRILESAGYQNVEFRTALNGEEALRIVPEWQPDLILTDWHMPTMTGIEMLQVLKQSGQEHIKVGFVTTESSAKRIEEARRNGAVFVVNKPFNNDQLKQAVLAVVQGEAGAEQAIEAVAEKATDDTPPEQLLTETADMRKLLIQQLQMPCSLEPVPPVSIDSIRLPSLIGVYTEGSSKAVHAVCILDLNATCMIGGIIARLTPEQVKEAIASGTLSRDIFENASSFLADMATLIATNTSTEKLRMSSSHLVQKPFEKLYEAMKKNHGRTDFNVSFSQYGDGLISILLN